MADLRELYQQLILDHGRNPRNFGTLTAATTSKEGFNPLCGDKITVYVIEEAGQIKDIRFDGVGCAISMASASLMTQAIKNKSIAVVKMLFTQFHEAVTNQSTPDLSQLGKLAVLIGVKEYPARVKCATLCWHTVQAALDHSTEMISTE